MLITTDAVITQEKTTNAIYVSLQDDEQQVKKTVQFYPEAFLDLDAKGYVVGIEILGVTLPLAHEDS